MNRSWMLACLFAMSCTPAAPAADAPADVAQARAIFDRWISHVERGTYDSLPSLLTKDFVFVMEGRRLSGPELLTMMKSFQATDVHVQLGQVTTHTSGDVGYLVYDDKESLKVAGQTTNVSETGSVVMRRDGDKWQIALWIVTSPPPAPSK